MYCYRTLRIMALHLLFMWFTGREHFVDISNWDWAPQLYVLIGSGFLQREASLMKGEDFVYLWV